MRHGKREKLVFAGDSITDAGRREDAHVPLGNGYVALVSTLLNAKYPELELEFHNHGVAGDTVLELARRWDEIFELRPDWLSILIGINDLWRTCASEDETPVPVGVYEAEYRGLLNTAKTSLNCKLVLLEPFLIEPDANDSLRSELTRYSEVVQGFVEAFDALLVPLQLEFDKALRAREPAFWSADRVHPTLAGHGLIARAVLRVLGYGEI